MTSVIDLKSLTDVYFIISYRNILLRSSLILLTHSHGYQWNLIDDFSYRVKVVHVCSWKPNSFVHNVEQSETKTVLSSLIDTFFISHPVRSFAAVSNSRCLDSEKHTTLLTSFCVSKSILKYGLLDFLLFFNFIFHSQHISNDSFLFRFCS